MLDSLVSPITRTLDRQIDWCILGDYLIAVRQLIRALTTYLYVALPILCSYIPIFVGFIIFLVRNKGIVLGEFFSILRLIRGR
jgi:hypothetical protein